MKRSIPLFIATAILFSSASARADERATRLINPPNSPAYIQRCQIDDSGWERQAYINVENRSHHTLISFDVEYKFYDSDSAMFAEAKYKYTPGEVQGTGEVQQYSGAIFPTNSEPFTATSYVTCRIVGAQLSGHNTWVVGQPWREKLVPISGSGDPAAVSGGDGQRRSLRNVRVTVENAWADASRDHGVFVHDRVALQSPDGAVAVQASDLALSVRLADGSERQYRGMGKPAPQYPKTDWTTNQTTYVPTVAPNEDLGRLGSIVVPRDHPVETIVTFFIPDALASADDNRRVSVSR